MQIPFLRRGGEPPGTLLAGAALLVVLCLLHVAVFDRTPGDDDAYFAGALDRQTLAAFLLDRYLHWSGRLPIDALAALLLDRLWIWRIVNAAMVVWLCVGAGRLGFGDRFPPVTRACCAFALLWCMPLPVLREGAFWVSGSFNYLWPTAAGLAATTALFDRRERGPWAWAGLALAGGFAAYHEQVALAMLAMGVPRAFWLWRTGRLTCGDLALLGCMVVNAVINYGAPGVQARYEAEIPRHFPGFAQLSWCDKGVLGIEVVKKLARSGNVLLLLSVAAVVAVAARAGWSRGAKRAVFAACACLVVAMASRMVPAVLVALGFAGLIGGVGLALRDDGRREAAWFTWSMAVGLGTFAAMALSPTVHGSGLRTAFVACTVWLVATCRMAAAVRERCGVRACAWMIGVAACVAATRIVETALR